MLAYFLTMNIIVLRTGIIVTTLLAAAAATAQLGPVLPPAGGMLGRVAPLTGSVAEVVARPAQALAAARLDHIAELVRTYPRAIALDANGLPARAGEVLVDDPDDALIASARAKGFRLLERDSALGIAYARLSTPPGQSLARSVKTLRGLGARNPTADQLHAPSGLAADPVPPAAGSGPRVGMIDGGVAGPVAAQRGFAVGAPRASDHGTAIASLIAGRPGVRGAAPGARVFAADVYGGDPAGGSASAIARALAWLVGEQVPVVTISLTGPANPILARVVAAAQARGTIVVAAVGNDGPASPFAYPASYPGVIAVTAVDARKRVLIEAGRATHLDYAAPGADLVAANARGVGPVRGTSFAAPLVAATIVRFYPTPDPARRAAALARVDAGTERLGKRYGRGLVCGDCATRR